MALFEEMMGGGLSAGQATAINGQTTLTASAAGSSQTDATLIKTSNTVFSTVGSGAGAILPATTVPGSCLVYNGGLNTLTIYPNTGSKINNGSTNSGVSLATNTAMLFIRLSTTQWIAFLSA